MSVRPLLQLTRDHFEDKDTALRSKSIPVDIFNSEFKNRIGDLIETFKSHNIAVGLAAPQIGIFIRAAVINIDKEKPEPHLVLINPVIVFQTEDSEEKFEACLSLPRFKGKVLRAKSIVVEYQDVDGAKMQLKAEGFLARVIQHEIDHLDGILYVDRMANLSELEPTDIVKEDRPKEE